MSLFKRSQQLSDVARGSQDGTLKFRSIDQRQVELGHRREEIASRGAEIHCRNSNKNCGNDQEWKHELNLESSLFSWGSINNLLHSVRFGGLGILIRLDFESYAVNYVGF